MGWLLSTSENLILSKCKELSAAENASWLCVLIESQVQKSALKACSTHCPRHTHDLKGKDPIYYSMPQFLRLQNGIIRTLYLSKGLRAQNRWHRAAPMSHCSRPRITQKYLKRWGIFYSSESDWLVELYWDFGPSEIANLKKKNGLENESAFSLILFPSSHTTPSLCLPCSKFFFFLNLLL